MKWIDECSNQLYSALTFQGGAAWRSHLKADLGRTKGIKALLDDHDDDALQRLMTNLGGHDMVATLEAFNAVAVVDAGGQVERQVHGLMEPRLRRAAAILFVHLRALARRPAAAPAKHLAVAAPGVPGVPGRQVADPHPRADGGPALRAASGKKHRHMTSAGRAAEVNPLPVDRIASEHPVDGV